MFLDASDHPSIHPGGNTSTQIHHHRALLMDGGQKIKDHRIIISWVGIFCVHRLSGPIKSNIV
jgi:hypothetical protein